MQDRLAGTYVVFGRGSDNFEIVGSTLKHKTAGGPPRTFAIWPRSRDWWGMIGRALEGALCLTVIVVVPIVGFWVIGVILGSGVRVGYALMELVF